jgi:hypothetical protein
VRRISTATALAVLFGSVVLMGSGATPAMADSTAVLPAGSAGKIMVDGVHQRVFVSDPVGAEVIATDYSGKVLGTLKSLTGVLDLALSADSGTLYAASQSLHAIVAIDTTTLTETARYAVDVERGPRYLAVAGGKVWFGYGDQWDGNIGAVDVSAAEPTVTLGLGGGDASGNGSWYDPPHLESDPAQPNTLVAVEEGISASGIAVYDVSTGTPVRTGLRNGYDDGVGFATDIDLSPDGSRVTVDGWRNYSTDAPLTYLGDYGTQNSGGTDIRSDGTVATGNANKVYVYRQGATSAWRSYTLPDDLMRGGLAWSADGSRIFALTNDGDGTEGVTALQVLTDPDKTVTKVTVTAPATADRAKKLTVTGKAVNNAPLPAGTPLKVTRTDLESPKGKALPDATVNADGTFTFTDTPPAGSKVKYSVAYPGDADRTGASGSDTVTVSRKSPTLTLNKNGRTYAYGTDVTFTAHLGTTYKNRVVEIWADPYGSDKPRKLVKKGTVNANGNLSVKLHLTRDTALSTVFAGDSRYAPKTAKSTAYTRVKVSTALSKYYKTGHIGSTKYYYFHKSTDAIATTTMTYYRGRSQKLELQVRFDGEWETVGSEYFSLNSSGKSKVDLGSPGESGIQARVRGSYINSSSGDTVNSTTHGAWKYLYFSE